MLIVEEQHLITLVLSHTYFSDQNPIIILFRRKIFWKNFVKTEKQALERKRKSDSMTEEPMLDKPKRLKSKLPIFLRQIETFLYLNAPSRDAYLDKTTLRQRIKELRDLQLN